MLLGMSDHSLVYPWLVEMFYLALHDGEHKYLVNPRSMDVDS